MALRVSARAMVFSYHRPMGCLPIPLFALIGFGIGYLVDSRTGSVWGGGIGLVIGLVLMVVVFRAMRKANR